MKASEVINKLSKLVYLFGDQEVWIHTSGGQVYPVNSNITGDADDTTFYLDIVNDEVHYTDRETK